MLQGSDRPWQFARCRIGIESQMADHPTVQIIKGRQTARQYLRSYVPKQLEPLGYRVQARAVDDPDLFKMLPQGMYRRRITGLSLRQHLDQKGLIQVGKETPGQALAALEKRFWARLYRGPTRAVAECCFLQGLGQGLRSTQNDFSPKRYQGLETPLSFAFGGACLLKDRLAQACCQMIMEKLNRAQQLDSLL